MTIRQEITRPDILDRAPPKLVVSADLLPGAQGCIDAIVVLLGAFLCFQTLVPASEFAERYYVFAAIFCTLFVISLLYLGGMYRFATLLSPLYRLDVLLASVGAAFVGLWFVVGSLNIIEIYRVEWLYAFALSAASGLAITRAGCALGLRRLWQAGHVGRRMAVLGAGAEGRRFLLRSAASLEASKVCGVYDPETPLIGSSIAGHMVLGGLDALIQDVRQNRIDEIVIALPGSQADLHTPAIQRLRELPVSVFVAPDLFSFGAPVRQAEGHMAALPVFEVWQRPISGWSRYLKLLEDLVLASTAIVLLAPALALIALAIRLDTSGPVLFRQKRLGFNNEQFEIFKFRTMYHRQVPEARVIQASRGDPRVTPVGRFLRKTSLDELPQLLNVLNGTMSLVGPRPHALNHNEEFSRTVRGYFGRHKVKPGITGWAQVNGLRGEIDSHDKLEARVAHDMHYAENWSLFLDLRILIATVAVVFFQRSAY